ncbi:MAG: phosphomannomutase/phosphoglucomutase [Myxococcales bacterium]|nr:phosphomannomutase/phosphoglucomutase [Myxococcales bacterium]
MSAESSFPAHIFREYDIRGVADRDLTDEVTRRIGAGLARLLRPASGKAPHVVVGRDCRASGPRLFEALLQGLTSGGAHVTDIGVGPTPLVYFGVHHLDADGGVMITGSHNPGNENGFKIMKGKASFFGDDIRALKELASGGELTERSRGSIETVPIQEAYLSQLRQDISLGQRKLKVVLDAGNGAGGPLGVQALKGCGVEPIQLFCDMNGSFPNHHPDPTVVENLKDLMTTMAREGADVGIAFDGDADRLGVVDRDGSVIWGDRLLALFARRVLEQRPGAAVIGEVKCSQSMYDDIAKHGGKPIMWRTGHSLIKSKMKQEHAALAGEMSGHFFFADRYFGFDDGIYAALRLLEILSHTGQTISELLSDLPQGHTTPEIRMDCPDDKKFAVVERVKQALSGDGELSDIDGVRVSYPDGSWALARASNTGPIIVLRFEAQTPERLAQLRSHVEGLVAEATAST